MAFPMLGWWRVGNGMVSTLNLSNEAYGWKATVSHVRVVGGEGGTINTWPIGGSNGPDQLH